MRKNTDTKEILLKDYLAFRAATRRDTDKLISRFEKFMAREQLEADDELLLPLLSLKTLRAENESVLLEEIFKIAAPVFEKLKDASDWTYMQLYVLAGIIGYNPNYHEGMAFMHKVLDAIKDRSEADKKYKAICISMHMNMTLRIVRAKYLDSNLDEGELAAAFKHSYGYAMEHAENKNLPLQYALQIRLGIFEGNEDIYKTGLAKLKELKQKKIYKHAKYELGEHLRFMDSNLDTPLANFFVGYNTRMMRKRQGKTISELAEAMGIDENVMSALERGDGGASIVTLKKLATLLRVTTDYLLFGDQSKNEALEDLFVLDMKLVMKNATKEEKNFILSHARMFMKR